MKKFYLLCIPLIAGCLSPAREDSTHWTIDFERGQASAVVQDRIGESVRVAAVDIRAPYAGQRLTVLRPDGSLAFDSFNTFASSPALLLRGAVCDAVEASGRFGRVFSSCSTAQTKYAIEIIVTKLALDCRMPDKRTACIDFTLMLLQGREAVAIVRGSGVEEAGENFSEAFSTAFVHAMKDALGKLTLK